MVVGHFNCSLSATLRSVNSRSTITLYPLEKYFVVSTPPILHWPLQAGALDLQVPVSEGASANFVDGVLSLSGQPFWHGVDLIFSLAVIAIFVAVLYGRYDLPPQASGRMAVEIERTAARQASGACGKRCFLR